MIGRPVALRIDSRESPLGLDSPEPTFAWQLPPGCGDQVAYQAQVSLDGELVWDSGQVERAKPYGIPYDGLPLMSSRRYEWRVRVWDETGSSDWSEQASFETGILDPDLWQARWITGPAPTGKADRPVLYLRATVELQAQVVRARAYVSALGWYRFFVNGVDLTGPALVPRWTPFDHYVEYQVYDLTDALTTGPNVLAMSVGDGRFRGALGVMHKHGVFGDRLAGFVQIHLDLADGASTVLTSGREWQAGSGRIRTADPKDGERVDLRIPDEDWLGRPEAPARFGAAEVLDTSRTLVAEEVARVQEIGRLPAKSVTRSPAGKQLVDFGQNFAGVVRIKLGGSKGSTVRLTHSELLRLDGELDTDYVNPMPFARGGPQRDEVILDGAESWYQPWFTIHGFRYVEVDGLDRELGVADIEGIVLSSALPEAGTFDCSNSDLFQLYSNVQWSLRSNFVDTATDCPTRERSGWTGDVQVFTPTATKLVDAQAYLGRYLRNAAVEQLPNGRLPTSVPAEASSSGGRPKDNFTTTSVGWGDVLVLTPWELYRAYGDPAILERQYASMTAWVDSLALRARTKRSSLRRLRGSGRASEDYLVDTGFHYGEWLRPGEGAIAALADVQLRTKGIVATAYLEHSSRVLSRIAEVLGRTEDAARYLKLADATRNAWRRAFLRDDGRIGGDRQDDYVRALAFGLVDTEQQEQAVERLVKLVEEAGDHLATGFLSTPMLLRVLADGGRPDVAYRVLLQETNPSWLYQVRRGATTTWETWEGYKANGEAKYSHNHYAFGAVADFLVERVAGLAPAAPGYQEIEVRPTVGGGLTHARATLETPYGLAQTAWRREGDEVTLDVVVPPGATARIHAGSEVHEVASGTHRYHWLIR